MGVLGIGFDLVTVSEFAEQLNRPGRQCSTTSHRASVGTPYPELRTGRHFAARWAAKEAVIKAWSTSLFASPPVLGEMIHNQIEVVSDAWGRPSIRFAVTSPNTSPE